MPAKLTISAKPEWFIAAATVADRYLKDRFGTHVNHSFRSRLNVSGGIISFSPDKFFDVWGDEKHVHVSQTSAPRY